jgi:hypothetical protein
MLRNYLKTAWRNLLRNKAHTAINLTGLSVGLTCGLLILLWAQSELSVDGYHAHGARIYKLYERAFQNNAFTADYDMPAPLSAALVRQIPGIEYAVNTDELATLHAFRGGNKTAKVAGTFATADLFRMFSYRLLQGDAQTALASPVSIVLSEKTARLFFGSAAAAMGKTMRYEDKFDLMVTGVFADLGERDSYKFDYVINWPTYLRLYPSQLRWDNSGTWTFVQLRPDADAVLVDKKIRYFLSQYNPPGPGFRLELEMQPFREVYLHSHFENGRLAGGGIEYVRLFSIVAVFILLMACINFMNLTTARSLKRAREIGVRKVMGAVRGALIRQFIGESLLLTVVAVVFALVLMGLVLPLFNIVTLKQLSLPFGEPLFWGRLALLTVVTGVVTGSYPALFLSSFNPVVVLKGMLKLDTGAVCFRKGLVVFQFVLSAVLIVATIVVSRQVHYIQRMDLGYDRGNLLYVPIEGDLVGKHDVYRTEALKLPGVEAVSSISMTPTVIDDGTSSVDWDGKAPHENVSFVFAGAGYDLVPTMKLALSAGRGFSRAFATDSNAVIVNQAALDIMGYRDGLGRSLTLWGVKRKIVGVLKNFHFASLREKMQPFIIYLIHHDDLDGASFLVRIKPGATAATLADLEGLGKKLNPAFPFSYTFSDDEYAKLYTGERVAGRLANIFAGLAILISCLGLLGLAMFTVEQRVKEIGIRKVLGAGVASLFGLLSMEFLWLVGIASLIGAPVAWFAMSSWLQGYAYHTSLEWWIFVLAAGLVLVIALVTVSFQAVKASMANPIKSLRSE